MQAGTETAIKSCSRRRRADESLFMNAGTHAQILTYTHVRKKCLSVADSSSGEIKSQLYINRMRCEQLNA